MRQDSATGFVACLELAGAGSAVAMNAVGEAYCLGRGVAPDETKGEHWYGLAYRAGSRQALLNYGHMLTRRGDLAGAEAVFRKGASQGWSAAIHRLATIQLEQGGAAGREMEARLLLQQAAAPGNPAARWEFVQLMLRARFGLRNIPRAVAMTWAIAMELVVASEAERFVPEPTTKSGETLH
jgi:hypothetical protein